MARTVLLSSLVAISAVMSAPVFASPFRVGEPAPDITLPSIADGSRTSLADFKGRRLMLHVWASW